MRKNESLKHQARKRIADVATIGCSTKKFVEWYGKTYPAGIYDKKTFDCYKSLSVEYCAWLRENYPDCKKIEGSEEYAAQFLTYKSGTNVSDWQIGTYASMLAILYKCSIECFVVSEDGTISFISLTSDEKVPEESPAETGTVDNTAESSSIISQADNEKRADNPDDTQNNRAEEDRLCTFDIYEDEPDEIKPEKATDFIDFCIGTGLKMSEIKAICPKDVYRKSDGRLYINVPLSRRTIAREAVVLEEYETIVERYAVKVGMNERLFRKITSDLDVNDYRRTYATILYLRTAREEYEISNEKEIYISSDENGDIVFDKNALLYVGEQTGYKTAGSVVSLCIQTDKVKEAYR